MTDSRILVFGFGTMTSAMVEGWLRAGRDPASITAYNPRPKPVPDGVTLTTEMPAEAPDYLLLGFKPAMLPAIAPQIAHLAGPRTVVLSVLAGVTLATLRQAFPQAQAVVRLMPNLASALGKSANALLAEGLDEEGRGHVAALAGALGHSEWLEDESLFDLVTALAGSGPAFVYRFIDALAAAAADLGLEPGQAQRMALAMTEGAVLLAKGSEYSPQELADRVASPGGMTRKGLDVLDRDKSLETLLNRCLAAARDRGREMGAAPPPKA